ncbi:MAG: hypothetical protein NT061_04580 [Spirochaetes bacterium]|nr:hypothetical protein [Spirochaetota bacterium]
MRKKFEEHFLGFKLPENEWQEIAAAVEAHSRHDSSAILSPSASST